MIAELRKKFIRTSAVSIFLVFFCIFLVLSIFSVVQMEHTVDTLTDAIADNDGVFPAFEPADQTAPSHRLPYDQVITEETQFSTRFFAVWLDGDNQVTSVNTDAISSLTDAEVKEYAAQAVAEGAERGWISDCRYRMVQTETGTLLVFVNGSTNRMMTWRLLVTAFLVLFGSAVLILTLTVILSRRVVRPMAESYEKQKQFITDANHELKTPLTLILSNLDIVESEFGKSEWLDDIRSEGKRMEQLINQLVTLSRMDESGAQPVFCSFSLSAAAADTVSEFQALAAAHGKRISAQIAPEVEYRGEEALIRRLLSILLDNAVKYCDDGGEIQVTVVKKRHPVITVENPCADVEQLALDRLFDRFYRADQARTYSGSFGVGLSIARSIVRNHHSSINAYRKGQKIGFQVELK
jgi:two-component system sensor histidine kinase CiaH